MSEPHPLVGKYVRVWQRMDGGPPVDPHVGPSEVLDVRGGWVLVRAPDGREVWFWGDATPGMEEVDPAPP